MKSNKQKKQYIIAIFVIFFILAILSNIFPEKDKYSNNYKNNYSNDKTLKIISSSENQELEGIITSYADKKGYDIEIEYAGTLDIMQKLNDGEKYDAVWVSNSIWLYMLNNNIAVQNSKYTSINPVIFGITKSKAEELGMVGKTVYTQDIVEAITSGKLKFSMSNPTSTNSGASAYLGLLSTLAGNPEVLTEKELDDENLKKALTNLFSGLERSSGSEEFLEELFLNGDYEAVVTYESSIININKQLEKQGKEPLYAIYPVDGVSISDSPFAYIDNGDDSKKKIFSDIQSYILSDEGQALLQQKGRRTWYGGINENVDKTIFNPDWGIDTSKYISPIKYPNTNVIKLALNMYQNELRKPVHVVFCLDYSGSMNFSGYDELVEAMDYILTEEAANDFIQFAEKDKIDVIPFSGSVLATWSTNNGKDTENILNSIHALEPTGTTAIYPAAIEALNLIKDDDPELYNSSVILMTDGQGNVGTYRELQQAYKALNKEVPIYSIMFGDADEYQLSDIADLTNAKVFDGKTDLVKAFKEVRGYN